MSRHPHVVWDMGGIIYRYFTELMVEFGRRSGWPLHRLALGPTGELPDGEYERLLTGEIDEPDYIGMVVDRLRRSGIEFDPVTDLHWNGELRPETMGLIGKLAEMNHRQALLTNDASRWLGPGWWTTWEHAGSFEVMVDVATIGVRKPAPEPYLAVTTALGVEPDECLFVDDLPVNIRGAESVGMEGFLFSVTDPGGSVMRLRKRLDLSPGPMDPSTGS